MTPIPPTRPEGYADWLKQRLFLGEIMCTHWIPAYAGMTVGRGCGNLFKASGVNDGDDPT